MSEEANPAPVPAAAGPAPTGTTWPLVAAVAAIVAAVLAMLALVLLISLSWDVASLHGQVRKLTQSAKSIEGEIQQIKEIAVPPTPAIEQPAVPPRPTHIDAGDSAQDCIVRPGSKNPLADCLK